MIKRKKFRNLILATFTKKVNKLQNNRLSEFFFSFNLPFLRKDIHNYNKFFFLLRQKLQKVNKKNQKLFFSNNYLFNYFYFLFLKLSSKNTLHKNFYSFTSYFFYLNTCRSLFFDFYNNIDLLYNIENNNVILTLKNSEFFKKIVLYSNVVQNYLWFLKKKFQKNVFVIDSCNKKNFTKYFYIQNSTYFFASKKIHKLRKNPKMKKSKIYLPNFLFKTSNIDILDKKTFKTIYKKKIKFGLFKYNLIKEKKSLQTKNLQSITSLSLREKLFDIKNWYRKHRKFSKFQRKIILRKYKKRRKNKFYNKKIYFKKLNAQRENFSKIFSFSNGETVLLQRNQKINILQNNEKLKFNLLNKDLFSSFLKFSSKKQIYNLQVKNLVDNILSKFLNVKKVNFTNVKNVTLLTFRYSLLTFIKNFFLLKITKYKKKNSLSLKPGFLVINSYKNNLFASFLTDKKEVAVKLSLGLLKFNEKKYDFLSYVNVFRGLSFLLFYYGNISNIIKNYQKTLKIGEVRINFIKRNVLRNKRKRKKVILQVFLLKYGRYVKKVQKRFDRKIKKNKTLFLFLANNRKFRVSLQRLFMKRVKKFVTENYRSKRHRRNNYKRYSYFESRMRFLVLMELEMLRAEKRLAHNLRYGIVNPGFGFKKAEELDLVVNQDENGLQESILKKKRKIKTTLVDYKKKIHAIAERSTHQILAVYRDYIRSKFRRPFFFRHMDFYRPRRIRMYNVKKEFKNDKRYKRIKLQHRKLSSLFKFKKLLTKKKRTRRRRIRKKKISIRNLQIFKLLNNKLQKNVLRVIYDFRKLLTKRTSLFSKYRTLTKKQKINLVFIGKFIFPKLWLKYLDRNKKLHRLASDAKRHNLWINSFLKDVNYGKGNPQTIEQIFADKAKYRAKYADKKYKRRKFRKKTIFRLKLQKVRNIKRKIFLNLQKKKVFLKKFRRFTLNFIMSWGLFFFKKQLKIQLIDKTLNYFQYSLRQFILIKNYLTQIKTKKYFIRIKMKYAGDLADLIYFNLERFFQTAQRKRWMRFYSKLIRIYFSKYKSIKRKKRIYLSTYKF